MFSSLDSESEDEETKNKQLMTSKLAKTLDELCTKVSEFFIYIYFQRVLESKVYYLMKDINYFIVHISFYVTFFNEFIFFLIISLYIAFIAGRRKN